MTNSGQSTTFNYFVGSGSVLTDTTKTTVDLKPLQLGLFNSKNYKALAQQTSAKVVPEIIIAMGSPNTEKIAWTNAAMSFKTVPIRADKLIAWRKSTPKKALNQKVAIGWDGVSDCKTITAECDETYSLFIKVDGSPASRFFGAKPLTETFVYNTGCCKCVPDPLDPLSEICTTDVEKMVDNFVLQVNKSILSPFIKAEKIVKYVTPPVLEKVNYQTYTITLADEGGTLDLARIQVAYPDVDITRTNRTGILSTYSLTQLASLPAPTSFSNENIRVISNCTSCPVGYTLVPKTYKYKVQRQDTGVIADIATVAGDYTNPSAYRLSYVNGESTYIVTNITGVEPAPVAIGDIITYIGFDGSYCELTTPETIDWVATDLCFKTVRELCIVLGDGKCPDPVAQLADLVAFYQGKKNVVSGSIALLDDGSCANSYTLKQLSKNIMCPGCTTEIAEYETLDNYKGFSWGNCCDIAEPNEIDKIGIILTGAYVNTEFGECSFEYSDFVELDLPRITVRQGEFVQLENKCGKAWDVTLLQAPQYPTGVGSNVKKDYIEIMSTKGQKWSDSPRWREINGYNYDFIKTNKFYKSFYLEFEALDKFFTSTGFGGNDFKQTIVISFEENQDTSDFEKLLESWISSSRPDLIDSDHQDNLYR